MSRPDRRRYRGRDADPLHLCSWCDQEQAEAVLTVDQPAQTAVMSLGPDCLLKLNALRLGIQVSAVQAHGHSRPTTATDGDDDGQQ